MKFTISDQLRDWLQRDGLAVLAQSESVDINDSDFNKHLYELKRGDRPESEHQDAAAYRCLTMDQGHPGEKALPNIAQSVLFEQNRRILIQQEHIHQKALAHADESIKRLDSIIEHAGGIDGVSSKLSAIEGGIKSESHLLRILVESTSARNIAETKSCAEAVERGAQRFVHEINQANKTLDTLPKLLHDIHLKTQAESTRERLITRLFIVVGVVILLIGLLATRAHGQNTNGAIVVAVCGTPPATYPAAGQRAPATVDVNGNTCTPSGSGGTSSNFNAAFPASGTAAGFKDASGNMAGANLDASGFLKVNVAAGSTGNGAASNTGAAVPTQADYLGLNVGGTLRGQTGVNPSGTVYAGQQDITSFGGTTVIGASTSGLFTSAVGVVESTQPSGLTTNQYRSLSMTAAGATRVATGSDIFNVTVNAALPAGSNTVGAVTQASGPWTTNQTQFGSTAVVAAATAGLTTTAGGVVETTQPSGLTTNQYRALSMTAAGATRVATGSDVFNVTINAALPTGANTIGAVTQASGPWTSNLTQINTTALLAGNGVTGTGSPRVTIASDNTAFTVNAAESTAASMANGWTVAVGMGSGGTNTALVTDPCETSAGVYVTAQISTSTTIITGTASKFISLCKVDIYVNGTATGWAVVEGTGTLCATNLAVHYMGGTTAATGPSFTANQGWVDGDGRHAISAMTRAADNICLLLTAANTVNYNIKYVSQ